MSDDWDDVGSPSQQGELAREWNVRREQHYNVILLAELDLSRCIGQVGTGPALMYLPTPAERLSGRPGCRQRADDTARVRHW